MKLLHREDVLDAGYDLPATGLCANIGDAEMQQLRFGGEWILAEDETLVADGHEQRYLYMVVSGEVAITKVNDQGKSQQIATLGTGAAFGEMAFLSGGVASANVQAIGETILWRMDHETLLGFIGEHGVAGGQLCLNVASILSGRLVEGNKKVIDMGKELQASLAQLKSVAGAGSGKNSQALQQMQGKVSNMQNAFKGGAVKKSTNIFAMASTVVAVLSTLGMIGLFVSYDDSSIQEAATLGKKVKKLEANEEFYLGLKRRLEEENKQLVQQEKQIKKEKEEVASNLSQSMSEAQDLRGQIDRLENELSEAKDNLVRAQKVQPVEVPVEPQVNEEEKQDFKETLVTWTKSNTTLVFPLSVQIAKDAISLQNNTGQVRIPIKVGQTVKALRFYPNSNKYLVVAQENSDKFLATVTLDNTNFFQLVAQIYKKRQEFLGKDYSNLPSLEEGPNGNKILNNSPKPNVTPQMLSSSITDGNGKNIIRGVAQNPQLSENVLDTVSPKEAKGETVDTSDHGTNCVCKDCRAKKIGKGSLFPDL
jgi:hypothetical protein